jgi:hypothetical protein
MADVKARKIWEKPRNNARNPTQNLLRSLDKLCRQRRDEPPGSIVSCGSCSGSLDGSRALPRLPALVALPGHRRCSFAFVAVMRQPIDG